MLARNLAYHGRTKLEVRVELVFYELEWHIEEPAGRPGLVFRIRRLILLK